MYYWKTSDNNRYHWHSNCDKNKYPAEGWEKGSSPPKGREQCNECKAKDK
ncbi:hypothetical protein LCGC14_0258590 [marine sediment metagenome]|uniref:Uncharacterized protein n=1 Tax=marine sediment metagenome TaxID=412755 RepID=A0A0F9U727_9ZZZZ